MAVLVLAAAAGVFAAAAVLMHSVLRGPVTGESMYISVSDKAESNDLYAGSDRCRQRSARQWECSVFDQDGSGSASYRVVVDEDRSCWRAVLLKDDSEDEMPRTRRSCIHRWQ